MVVAFELAECKVINPKSKEKTEEKEKGDRQMEQRQVKPWNASFKCPHCKKDIQLRWRLVGVDLMQRR